MRKTVRDMVLSAEKIVRPDSYQTNQRPHEGAKSNRYETEIIYIGAVVL